jgi:ribosomal-protein-alanine N-acetyltransferase
MRSKELHPAGCHFTAVWEFQVTGEKARAFEKTYGPRGDWARLFRQGQGYIRTQLIRDPDTPGRYLTLDFWTSRLAYQRFKRQNRAAYNALDKRCEKLSQNERLIGEFEKAVPAGLIWPAAQDRSAPNRTIVRLATAAHIPALIALEQHTQLAAHWSESAYGEILDPGASPRIAIVAEQADSSLLGFVVARVNSQECELENILVADGAQRRGVGTQLLHGLKEELQKRGVTRILLEVRNSNVAARALYEKCGFELNCRRKSYYRDPIEDAFLYGLKL